MKAINIRYVVYKIQETKHGENEPYKVDIEALKNFNSLSDANKYLEAQKIIESAEESYDWLKVQFKVSPLFFNTKIKSKDEKTA